MKRIFTLLWFALAACSFKTTAQTTCNAEFSWQLINGNTVKFIPVSTDSIFTVHEWNFDDGNYSYNVMPIHSYASNGTYHVIHRVIKYNGNTPVCTDSVMHTIIIQQAPNCTLVADFSWMTVTANALTIAFHNSSTPSAATDSVRWTFGDGTSLSGLQGDSNIANPAHVYTQAGTYTVCLRVKKNTNSGSCVKEICKTIIVQGTPCNFQVNWNWHLDSINPRKVYFTNLTVSPTSSAIATWYFGDGTSATSWNAVHEYAQPGSYIVCLKIKISNTCTRDKCDTIFIPTAPPPCNNQSNFSVLSTSNNSQAFTFIPAFQNNAAQYTWTFGDGTGSQSMIATHHYAQPGMYTACLTVWRGPNCASTTCKQVKVLIQVNCDSVHVNYTYQPDPQVPNKIHFYAHSNYPILGQTWTITKLPVSPGGSTVTLHQNNPTYLFQDTGYYRVCLRAVTPGGCVKEYCSVIHIQQVSNTCVLQAYPNPASNVVNVNVTLTQPGMIDAYVYNNQGMLVKEKHQTGVSGNNVVSININDLSAGMYTMKLIYGNHICYAVFQKL